MRRSLLLISLTALLALPGAHAAVQANCSQTSEPMTPLPDVGKKRYHGYQGGRYAKGKNTPIGGRRLRGDIVMTIYAGEVVYRAEAVLG